MKLSSVLSVVKGGVRVTVFDYLTDEMYLAGEVSKLLDLNEYHQSYKNCRVYGIDPKNDKLEVRILLED